MALTDGEKRRAARWFVNEVFKKNNVTAVVDRNDIFSAVDALDGWFSGRPGGGASNIAAIKTSLPGSFKTRFSNAGHNENQIVGLLLAALALVKSGNI